MKKNSNKSSESVQKCDKEKQVKNLNDPGIAKLVSKRLKDDIDLYCQTEYDDGHRNHLGASLIGNECSRYLWYVFRWVYHFKHTGRMQRLFNRGHKEEDRYIEWLKGIGCEVWADDLTNNTLFYVQETDEYFINKHEHELTNELGINVSMFPEHIARAKADGLKFPQYRISDVNGHFGGSLDAIVKLPQAYSIPEAVLGEFKTNGTGSGFSKLMSKGMAVTKHLHFAQTSTYGFKYGFQYCAYFNINKNDDDLHVELVKLDWNLGEQMIMKAEKIISSQTPPPKLSLKETYFECSYCDMKEICHKGKESEKNCRSCSKAYPVENAEWYCEEHQSIIPKDYIKAGCDMWDDIAKVEK